MTFVNFALLSGAGLIAIPIILHLIMRQKPKLLEFPALRFIQKRHDTNQRRLRLRHLLLLLLRAGAIALLAFALARPSVKFSSRMGSQEAPVAAALIFDAAPHMRYQRDKKTRLQAAQEMGSWLIAQLPPESEIAVFDSGMVPRSFDADRGLSKHRIDTLEVVPNPRPLSSIAGEAAAVLKKSELAVKEIYLFTDLSRSSWRADESATLQERLRGLNGVTVYLIDVGVKDPSDFGLGDLHLSSQVVAAGGSVSVQTDITCLGAAGERVIELELLGSSGTPQVTQQIKRLQPGDSQTVDFRLTSLKPGVQQGTVKIVGHDSLEEDDVRYLSVEVRPPWPVLVVAPPPTAESSLYLTEALAPTEMQKRNEASFRCTVIDYGQFADQKLDGFAAVFLLDPPGLDAGLWQRLANYAAEGHGVGVFLGRRALPIEAFNSLAAQQLLPAKIREEVPRESGTTYLVPQNYQHPILKDFAPYATRSPWSKFPVYRYWRVDDLAPDASMLIAYNDGRPALLERTIRTGQVAGHVLMMTTPVSDRANRRDAWNVLPVAFEMEAWPFFILAKRIAYYLVGSGEQQLNYFAGTNRVTLSVAAQGPRRYILERPDQSRDSTPVTPEKGELTVSSVEQVGNYKVHGVGEPFAPDRGFSVNLSSQATQLTRLTDQELSEIFGPFQPRVARSNEQIVRDVHDSRVGIEIYPWLILVFAGLLAIEYVVSNWFYKQQ